MKLRLDPATIRLAYENSLKDVETELVRHAVTLGLDLDSIDPYAWKPDTVSEHYQLNKPAYDVFENTLVKYRMVDQKLKELE